MSEGIFPSGRAMWAKFQNDKIGTLEVLEIYALNEIPNKIALWKELFAHLDFSIQ